MLLYKYITIKKSSTNLFISHKVEASPRILQISILLKVNFFEPEYASLSYQDVTGHVLCEMSLFSQLIFISLMHVPASLYTQTFI